MKKQLKKMIAGFLAVMLCMGICAMPMSGVGIKASAASHTVSEAMDWCNSLVNTTVGTGQCVALIKAYYAYLGATSPGGNACDYATNALPSGWTRVQGGEPQAGDILVYVGAKYGHVAIYAGGSVSYHQNMAGLYVEKKTNWPYYNSWYSQTEGGTKSYWGYIRPNFSAVSSSNFEYAIDTGISEGQTFELNGTMSLSGWAFNTDGSTTNVVYCFDDAQAYTFNKVNRDDVVAARGSKQRDCGFAQDISLSGLSVGQHKLSIWCESSSGAAGMFSAYFSVTYNQSPTISNVARSNLNESSFLVSCSVSDNTGVTDVNFVVWTDYNGQDDLKIHKGNISEDANGKYAWCVIDAAEHNSEVGNYNCDIYAYDATGNYGLYELRKIYVGNLIHFHSFTNENGGSLGVSMDGVPTISGKVKFWFIEYDVDSNYYINIWVDDTRVVYNSPSDNEGLITYIVDTTKLSNGQHSIKAELFDSHASYSVTKNFIVSNTKRTLTFNPNGGNCSVTSQSIYYNTPYGTLPTPTRTGYTFDGWYTSASGGTKITASTTVTTTSDQTLYAHWSHTHSYTSTVTKAATCTQTGVKTFKCSICGNSYTETIAATGHKTVTDTAIAATCTTDGKTEGSHCSVCGTIIKAQETVTAKGHTAEIIKGYAATCTADGLTDGEKCSVCGEILKEQTVISAKGHTAEIIKGCAETCTADGLTDGEKCSVCGEILREQTVISAKGHIAEAVIGYAATCTADGLVGGEKCSVCGKILKEQTVILATGHDYITVLIPATCTEDGSKTLYCADCSDTYTEEIIPAAGHTPETVKGYAATCSTDGLSDGEKCSVCGKILTAQEVIGATGHNYIGTVTTAPTCTETGVITYTCSCGDSYTEVLPLSEHSDADNDGVCDDCKEVVDSSAACNHICHKGGIAEFFYKIARFFWKLFNMQSKRYCECGRAHW